MTSTERAIQAAAERAATMGWEFSAREESLIEAALASGELHPADECPHKIEKERILNGLAAKLGDENMTLNESLVRRAEKAEAELAEVKREAGQFAREGGQFALEIQRLTDSEGRPKYEAKLADLKAKIEKGELILKGEVLPGARDR